MCTTNTIGPHIASRSLAEGVQVDSVLAAPIKEPWVPTEDEEEMLEGLLAREETWDASRKSKQQWNVGLDAGKTGAPVVARVWPALCSCA